MVLTGHLDDRPLPDLIRTLRVQRKSGRLQVEYADSPGSFFFEDGQLVDAQLGSLRGLEALYAALALDGASFNFNPLVRPPERSIDRQQQKFINDLVEVPRRENLAEIKVAGGARPAPATGALNASSQPAPRQLAAAHAELIAPLEERLTAVEQAVSATSRRFSRERLVYAVVISFLVGLMVVTALQALMNLRSPLADTTGAAAPVRQPGAARGASAPGEAAPLAASAASAKKGSADGAPEGRAVVATDASRAVATDASRAPAATQNGTPAATAALQGASPDSSRATGGARKTGGTSNARGYDVRVLLEVRDGQVTDARVLNPRPGAKAYEALALKTARQRRYPKNFTGGDTWKVRVKP